MSNSCTLPYYQPVLVWTPLRTEPLSRKLVLTILYLINPGIFIYGSFAVLLPITTKLCYFYSPINSVWEEWHLWWHGTHAEVRRQLVESLLSFRSVYPGSWTQITRLRGGCFYSLTHPINPSLVLLLEEPKFLSVCSSWCSQLNPEGRLWNTKCHIHNHITIPVRWNKFPE